MSDASRRLQPKILLSGYYGFHNLGDEAILVALVQGIRARLPDAELVVLSQTPQQTAERLGVRAIGRLALPVIWRELSDATVLISGGGSLLQDVTGLGSVPYYLGVMALARLRGVKAMMLGQGVGPLKRGFNRRIVGWVVNGLDAVTVRDEASAVLLGDCGLAANRLEVTADPVLAMKPVDSERVIALWHDLDVNPAHPVIGVSLRPWVSWTERQLKSFSAVLAQYAHQWQATIVLIPFHRPDDEALLEELRICLMARPEGDRPRVSTVSVALDPPEMLALLKRMDLVIGMRLHALIMAAAVQTPALGLTYDPKVSAFCDALGYPTVASIEELQDSERFSGVLAEVWSQRDAQKHHLVNEAACWSKQAARNLDLLEELVARP